MNESLPDGPAAPAVIQMLRFLPRPFEFLQSCARRYGDAFTVRLPGYGNIVMLGSPALVRQLFTSPPSTMLAGKANRFLEPALGKHSLLVTDGAEHDRHRRLLLPPMHGERMHLYGQVMVEETHTAVDRMPVGQRFSLRPYMKGIALNVILRAVFGLDSGTERDHIAAMLVEFLSVPNPLLTFIPHQYLDFPLSPLRTFLSRRERIDRELYAIIAARRASDTPDREDLLSVMMRSRDEAGQPMKDVELRDELLTMLAAGHATTAAALCWAFERLLAHGDVRERLLAEVASARSAGGELDLTQLPRLEYLDAVVRETLRLRPIFTDVLREVVAPYEIAGHLVPTGTLLAASIFLVHRRPDLYPEPDQFRPDRFLGTRSDPFAWLPFGGGARRCIGMAFALYQMKIVLGTVLLRTRFRSTTSRPARVKRDGITLAPHEGAKVMLLERIPRPSVRR